MLYLRYTILRLFNLDVFLAGEDGMRDVFARGSAGHDAAVCEGVMGYYDGMTQRAGNSGLQDPADAPGGASCDSYRQEPSAPAQSFNPPMDSVAASAPTAPNMQIDAPVGGFDEGQSGELPFEI